MENMEYSESLKMWVRSAPKSLRRKLIWAIVADYAMVAACGIGIGFILAEWLR